MTEQVRHENSPQVTWLLCTNRCDAMLYRAVNSCLDQTFADFELVIVANGPKAAEIVSALVPQYAEDSRVRVAATPVHLLNFSLTYGLHLARAPFIARMDSDDISEPDRLERQLARMYADPYLVALGSSYRQTDHMGKIGKHISLPELDSGIRRRLPFSNPFCHPAMMLRRDAVLAVGGYLGGQNAEDYDLWLRLALNPTWHFANLSTSLLLYNVGDSTAKRSRTAYANVAGALMRQFILTGQFRWLIGCLITCVKVAIRATKT